MEKRCSGCNTILLKSYEGSKLKLRTKFIVWDDFNKSIAKVQCSYCKIFNDMSFSFNTKPTEYVIKAEPKLIIKNLKKN